MKKVKNAILLLMAVIGMSASVEAQTEMSLKNNTSCSMDVKVAYATAPCTGSTTPIYVTLAANSSQSVTIPQGNSVRNVMVDDGSSNTIVSIICSGSWPQSTVGVIGCNGNPVTVTFHSAISFGIYE